MYTITKLYTDIPFAHRQHLHDGHCKFIHGHNWSFKFTFGCTELDKNGFVIDFGDLKFIKQFFKDKLDHAFVYNIGDEVSEKILQDFPEAYKAYAVTSCSCEGLAKHIFDTVTPMVTKQFGDRAFLVALEVIEDSKNTAEYCP